MAAVLLALAASASWGVSDFLGGLKTRSLNVLTVLAVSQPAGLILIAVVVAGRWAFPGGGWWLLWAVLAGIGGRNRNRGPLSRPRGRLDGDRRADHGRPPR